MLLLQCESERNGIPGGSDGKEYTCHRRPRSDPWVGKKGEVGNNGYPLQYSCLENPMDRGAWWAIYSPWGRNTFIKSDSPDTENPDSGEEAIHQEERPQTTYNYIKSLESWRMTDMLDTQHWGLEEPHQNYKVF